MQYPFLSRRRRGMASPWLLAGFLGLSLLSPLAQATTGPEVQVTASFVIDFEFDWGRDGVYCASCNQGAGNARLAFSDGRQRLWVAQVDPDTGAFLPADGQGVLVDKHAAPATTFGNGPEWAVSAQGSQLVYSKYLSDQLPSKSTVGLGVASMVGGQWTTELLSDSLQRVSPIATMDLDAATPLIQYQDTGRVNTYWRLLADGSDEHPITVPGYSAGARRWVPGTHQIVITGSDAAGLSQVFLYDADTGATQQLTHERGSVSGAMMWRAPEYDNEYIFFAVVNAKTVVVYRQLPDTHGALSWQAIQRTPLPASYPYVWSPEYFVHNGRSYIFFQMNQSPVAWTLNSPSQIGMVGVLPENSTLQNLTPDADTVRMRMDPEYYITSQGPFIYYNRFRAQGPASPGNSEGVWRVDTGLGPALSPLRQGH